MFFQDLAAAWLRRCGCTVFDPGQRLPPPAPAECVAVLDAAGGYVVLPPGGTLPIGLCKTTLALQGYTVHLPGETCPVPEITLNAAVDRLEAAGCRVLMPGQAPPFNADDAVLRLRGCRYTVLPPEEPPALGFWVPTDGHPLRLVRHVDGDIVTYGCQGHMHAVKIGSFARWRRDRKAVHRDIL